MLYTVISQTRQHIDHTAAYPVAAVPGHVDVYGYNLHVTTVHANDPDTAMAMARGPVATPPVDRGETTASTWTVIVLADTGVCPSWSVLAVLPGSHRVEGSYESMTTCRWVVEVDDPRVRSVAEADAFAYRQMSEWLNEAWY